jgi:spermidine/putrescine transport system permease protein
MKAKLARYSLAAYAGMVLVYLFIPIAVMVIFSFNQPRGSRNYEWNKFSLAAWKDPFKYPSLKDALVKSIEVATIATLVALVIGTALALALVKYRFRGKGFLNTLIVMPLTMPEIVLGFSLLMMFVSWNKERGFWTIVFSHIMFCVSYVATTVKARIRGFDWRLEEAAADLGATPVRTFTRVTFPLIAPGVFAAGLLTFALSLDDFTITYLNSGNTRTFPVEVWTQKRFQVPPQINVFGTLILLTATVLSVLGILAGRRRQRAMAAA